MSARLVPPRPPVQGEMPTQEGLVARFDGVHTQHVERLEQVDRMARTHEELGRQLKGDLLELKKHGEAVETLQEAPVGLFEGLIRRFTGNQQTLLRRSATEALVQRYETVSARLRRASAFTDDLHLAVLELQGEVRQLAHDREQAKENAVVSAERILELERALQRVLTEGGASDVVVDELNFELRLEGQQLKLFRTLETLCADHLAPARGLRDTLQQLHEEMQAFVLQATGTLSASGRRIQALGAAADAPIVVGELQESLDELQRAMVATESYLTQTRQLIAHRLPELSAKIEAERSVETLADTADFASFDREQARREAERALREAAMREVDAVGQDS